MNRESKNAVINKKANDAKKVITLQGGWVCPYCQHKNKASAKACAACGKPKGGISLAEEMDPDALSILGRYLEFHGGHDHKITVWAKGDEDDKVTFGPLGDDEYAIVKAYFHPEADEPKEWNASAVNESARIPDGIDPCYGVPEQEKYPLYDERHVRSAIKLFGHVEPRYERELAQAIIAKMRKYGIPYEMVGKDNKLYKYIPGKFLKD